MTLFKYLFILNFKFAFSHNSMSLNLSNLLYYSTIIEMISLLIINHTRLLSNIFAFKMTQITFISACFNAIILHFYFHTISSFSWPSVIYVFSQIILPFLHPFVNKFFRKCLHYFFSLLHFFYLEF